MKRIVSSQLKVGLEIHVELCARTKMFTRVASPAHPGASGAEPNTLIDPVVLALPGALPVPNRDAIEQAMLVGMALGCSISQRTRWDRKSYFYPDLPKAYQISQLDQPLCGPGEFELPPVEEAGPARTIRIRRAHLEEDAGKLLHEWPGGRPIGGSIVDLNRAGTALLEIVTEPDFDSAAQAELFARTLRGLCRFLGASEGVLEQGHMRFEPNINMSLVLDNGHAIETPIVEIKNLNSFRALREAIEYEQGEQPKRFLEDGRVLESGTKSTRGWSDARKETFLQREKEEAHDYRYFPDPDLPELQIDERSMRDVASRLTELPHQRAARYRSEYGLGAKEAQALVDRRETVEIFEQAVAGAGEQGVPARDSGRLCATIILQHVFALANETGVPPHETGLRPGQVAGIAALRAAERIGASAIGPLVRHLAGSSDSAEAAAGALGLEQTSSGEALIAWCELVIADPDNAKAVADVRAGKDAALGRLIGGVMQRSGGRAPAARVRELLLERLRGSS